MNIVKIILTLYLTILPTQGVNATNVTATYYSDRLQGRKMANGQKFSQSSNTIATNKYRLGSRVKVCYKGRCVTGVVRDRCNCAIDLSKSLFTQLAPLKKGKIPVKVYRY